MDVYPCPPSLQSVPFGLPFHRVFLRALPFCSLLSTGRGKGVVSLLVVGRPRDHLEAIRKAIFSEFCHPRMLEGGRGCFKRRDLSHEERLA